MGDILPSLSFTRGQLSYQERWVWRGQGGFFCSVATAPPIMKSSLAEWGCKVMLTHFVSVLLLLSCSSSLLSSPQQSIWAFGRLPLWQIQISSLCSDRCRNIFSLCVRLHCTLLPDSVKTFTSISKIKDNVRWCHGLWAVTACDTYSVRGVSRLMTAALTSYCVIELITYVSVGAGFCHIMFITILCAAAIWT